MRRSVVSRGAALSTVLVALALCSAPAVAQQYNAPDPGGNEAAVVPTPPPNKLFGLNESIAGGSFGHGPGTYATISQLAGANTIRTQIDWRIAEPAQDEWAEWAWEMWEHVYHSASAAGLRPIFVVGLAPTWARDPEYQSCTGLHLACRYPPSRGMYDEWMEFINEVVTRFPWAIIQVWNEPNLEPWWQPEPDPKRYAELLYWAHYTAKRINPDVPVIAGGIANNQDGNGGMPIREFLEEAYNAPEPYRFGESMDLLGVNMFPYSDKFGKNTLLAKSFQDIRDVQAAAGDDTKILITETGIGSGKPWPFNEKQQARASMRLYQRLITMQDVAGVVFHRLIEPGERGETPAAAREWGFAWTRYMPDDPVIPPKPVYCLFAEHAGNFYPPCLETTIAKGPKKGAKVKAGKKVVFKFKAPSLDAKFRCSLDRKKLRPCKRKLNAGKKLKPGKHVLYVRAVDRNGNAGPKLKHKFAVKKAKKAKKKQAKKKKGKKKRR